jgi:hypothetical protein
LRAIKEQGMRKSKTVFNAFNHGDIPTIACFTKATVDLGIDLDKLIAALQVYIDKFVAPVWGTPARLVKSTGFLKNKWAMVFLDDADQPDALAYHDLTPSGFPLAKVFVKSILDDGELVSVNAAHELVEMLVDPACNIMTTGPDLKAMYAYEVADPVEALTFKVKGVPMCNFVYPSYFESFRKPGSTQFDHLKKIKHPFQILSGGYQTVYKHSRWVQLFSSPVKKKKFKKEDRRGHRSETRKTGKLVRTNKKEIAIADQFELVLGNRIQ